MAKVKIENLSHSYFSQNNGHIEVLKNINLEIKDYEFIVVLGESGCGKTTFLNIIAGLIGQSKGKVWINNNKYEVNRPHFSRSLINQQPCLLPWMNVKDNIGFGCKLRNDNTDLSNRINKFIKLMGLQGFEKVYPSNLSVGMAQRVAFARSLIGKPEILLLDEPFTALDFITRARLQVELIRIWQKENYTIVFVTHDIDEAILMGQKIVILGNTPTTVEHVINLDYKYPRDLNDSNLFRLKIEIQKKFKEIMDIK